MSENLTQVIEEIRNVRDDVSKLRDNVDKKIERFYDKLDLKIESHRTEILEKIDGQREHREECFRSCSEMVNKKVSTRWFMWIIGFVVLGVVSVAGLSSVNKATIKEVGTIVKQHVESNKEQFEKIDENMKRIIGDMEYANPYERRR